MTTKVGPAVSSWGTQFQSLFFDTARAKLIDVETTADDNNIPDRVDIRTGNVQTGDAFGGVFTTKSKQMLVVGGFIAVALAAGFMLRRKRRR